MSVSFSKSFWRPPGINTTVNICINQDQVVQAMWDLRLCIQVQWSTARLSAYTLQKNWSLKHTHSAEPSLQNLNNWIGIKYWLLMILFKEINFEAEWKRITRYVCKSYWQEKYCEVGWKYWTCFSREGNGYQEVCSVSRSFSPLLIIPSTFNSSDTVIPSTIYISIKMLGLPLTTAECSYASSM